MIDTGRESGMILCHALGIDPSQVEEIHIIWRAGELPHARVRMLLNERSVYEVIQLRPVSEDQP